jgi:hypothetical protein
MSTRHAGCSLGGRSQRSRPFQMKKSKAGASIVSGVSVRLVIKEAGSALLPGEADAERAQVDVLAQAPHEPPGSFAARAAEHLAWAERHAPGVDSARYQVGPERSPEWSRARKDLLRALLAHAQTRGTLREISIEAPNSVAEQRLELMSVVEALWSLAPAARPAIRFVFEVTPRAALADKSPHAGVR